MDRIIKQLLTLLCLLLAACFAAPSADAFGLEIRVGGAQLGTIDYAEKNDLGTRNLLGFFGDHLGLRSGQSTS